MDIQRKMRYGGSGFNSVRSGSSGTPYLFYFKPGQNGIAWVIMTRPQNYQSLHHIEIVMNGQTYSSTSMDSYLHKAKFTGLQTETTYDIEFRTYTSATEGTAWTIERTYYCTNTQPADYPYANESGLITIPAYSSGYNYHSLHATCEENFTDGRCPYDQTTRNLFYWVCATNYENHPITGSMDASKCIRWPPGVVYVNVITQTTGSNTNAIKQRINEWIAWMNDLVEDSGTYFQLGSTTTKNARQMQVYIGTHTQLYGYNPDDITSGETQVYGGTWEYYYWGDCIYEARVKLCCDDRYPFNYCDPPFEGIVFEELTEASGPGYDQFNINNTVFSEVAYPGKTIGGPPGESWTRDENVIKILYSLGHYCSFPSNNYSYTSNYGSGISYTNYWNHYGPVDVNSYSIFFQLNISDGDCSDGEETLPSSYYAKFKSGRQYTLSSTYANAMAGDTKPETITNSSFRYTNPSAKSTPYFALPARPSYSSTAKVNGGFKVTVSGLSTSGEYYYVRAYLTDPTDTELENYDHYEQGWGNYNATSVSLAGLKYGRRYKLYLYSEYSASSDWILIGEGTVAPVQPTLTNVTYASTAVEFDVSAEGSVQDFIIANLYRDGVVVGTQKITTSTGHGYISFDNVDGEYELRVATSKDGIICVDSQGNQAPAIYRWSVSNRQYFYWADWTNNVRRNGTIPDINFGIWNEFVQNIYNTVCTFKGYGDSTMPANSSTYRSGFGLAAGKTFSEALNTYCKMTSSSKTLTAERFNIANYIISYLNNTGVSYKYDKADGPTQVIAADLIELQDKLNAIK